MERSKNSPLEQRESGNHEEPIITPTFGERLGWWLYEHTKFSRPVVRIGDNYGKPKYIGRRHEIYHQQQVEKLLDTQVKRFRETHKDSL